MNIKNILEEPSIEPWRSILLCGPSGSLKTITASMLPGPQCWIASNPGQQCGFPQVTWKKIKANKDNFVIKAQDYKHSDLIQFIANHEFGSWIVDDMTYLQHVYLAERKGTKSKATYDDWGFVLEWSRDITVLLNEVSGHLAVICLEQLIKDEVEGRIMGMPLVFGTFKHDLPALMRTCLHITSEPVPGKEPKRFVHAVPDTFWAWCKDREGILLPKEPHPDWIVKFLTEESKNETENGPSSPSMPKVP